MDIGIETGKVSVTRSGFDFEVYLIVGRKS